MSYSRRQVTRTLYYSNLPLTRSLLHENEALENEDRSTKHPKLENEAPKSRKRRPLNLENEAP